MDDAAIWLKHKEELIRYATVLAGPDRAEDVLSAVVVRILNGRGSLSEIDDPRPYLFKSVLNESQNQIRQSKRPPPLTDSTTEPAVEHRLDVINAVAALPNRQRAALYLTYWRDLPVREVAHLMGCRPGTVKRYLHLSRKRLKGVLEE